MRGHQAALLAGQPVEELVEAGRPETSQLRAVAHRKRREHVEDVFTAARQRAFVCDTKRPRDTGCSVGSLDKFKDFSTLFQG